MVNVRVAEGADLDVITSLDRLPRDRLSSVIAQQRVLLAEKHDDVVGVLRWGFLWDEIPFMNKLFVVAELRGQGIGRLLVDSWERRCRGHGHSLVWTSTQSDESAQDFYRKLGYRDMGVLDVPQQAPEIFLVKVL